MLMNELINTTATSINLSKLDFKLATGNGENKNVQSINLSKLDFK